MTKILAARIILILAAVIWLTGCGRSTVGLEGVTWKLESYGDTGNLQRALSEPAVTATFDRQERRVGGSGGCNSYGATYEVSGSRITITDIVSTKIACQPPIGTQESAYFNLLRDAQTFEIEGGRLTIDCGSQVLVFIEDKGNSGSKD